MLRPDTANMVRDQRIVSARPLISPALLREELTLTVRHARRVLAGRQSVGAILNGADDRLLVIVGPCSVHDPAAAKDYAQRLAKLAECLADQLCVVMRVYFEKPRTTIGWKGLINDPGLDGSYDVNRGLRMARKLLLDIVELGLPVGCEFLDPITPQYIADTVSWGSIGARTAQSQVHRQLCSGLSMPVGVKNSTEGDVQAAVDAAAAAAASHVFAGITDDGLAAILTTTGNPDCHVILRGSQAGPNYDAANVTDATQRLAKAGQQPRLIVDASHGNSGKDHCRQPVVAAEIAGRLASGERGVVGLMLESFLSSGRQQLILGEADRLAYGCSVTDACIDWDTTVTVLRTLAQAVDARRSGNHGTNAYGRAG
ncbi:MAG TPA: 3-deoxy-7-phosphoheptulonate synthase [Streptosporangiaceae bacterium]|nr:3-deoxy-7-phosphoheptulonate synthase [Streptosporangiaceae bacterium]